MIFIQQKMKNLLLTLTLIFAFASLASAATFAVNLTTDENDFNAGDGICDTNSAVTGNQCTLRAAIQEANATTDLDNINFTIPISGLRVIQLDFSLPSIARIPVLHCWIYSSRLKFLRTLDHYVTDAVLSVEIRKK